MKYALTDETMDYDGQTLRRIRALRDVLEGEVPEGSLGGWVASEANLSQTGDAWIAGEAIACEDARIEGEALLDDRAIARGRALVRGVATLHDDCEVTDDAVIEGAANLHGTTRIFGRAVIAPGEDGPTVTPGAWLDFDVRYGEDHAVFGHSDGAGLLVAVSDAGRVCVAGTWEREGFSGDLPAFREWLALAETAASVPILRAIEAYLAAL